MEAFRERFTYILESGWDQQTLLLLGLLAFLLALWLLVRILRYRPGAAAGGTEEAASSTLVSRVPPPPLPKIDKILSRLEGDYGEFVQIVRSVLDRTSSQTLLTRADLRRSFAHLEMLLGEPVKAPARAGSLGMTGSSPLSNADARREAKATMLTIIRLLQDVEGGGGGGQMDDLVDRFLEKV